MTPARNLLEEVGPGLAIARTHIRAVGRGSGAGLEIDTWLLFQVEDGRLTEIRSFASPEEASAAARAS